MNRGNANILFLNFHKRKFARVISKTGFRILDLTFGINHVPAKQLYPSKGNYGKVM